MRAGSTPGWYTHPARNRSSYLDPFLLGPAPSTSAKTVAPSPAPPAAPPAQSKSPAPTPSANGDDSAPIPPKERRKGAQWTPEEDSEILAKTSFTETQNWKTLLPQIDLDRNGDTIKQRHSHLKRLHYYPEGELTTNLGAEQLADLLQLQQRLAGTRILFLLLQSVSDRSSLG